MRNNRLMTGVVGVVLVGLMTACGGGGSGDASKATAAANQVNAKYGLPQGVTKLTVGTSVGTAPYEYYEAGNTELKGYEPDLLNEAAKRLGISLDWQATEFSALFSGLDSKRYDLLANGLIDRKSRQQNYDILDYIGDASGFLGKKGTTDKLKTLADVCGHSLGIHSGSTWEAFFDAESKKCIEAGRPPIETILVKDPTGATLAVGTGRVDFAVNQYPLLTFAAKQDDTTEVGDLKYLEGFVGLVFPKESPLIPPFQKVLDEMIQDGTYEAILKKWDLEKLAVKKTALNAGTAE